MEENGHYRDRRLSDPRVTPQPSKVAEDKGSGDDSEKLNYAPVPEITVNKDTCEDTKYSTAQIYRIGVLKLKRVKDWKLKH
jgi:hypothetical protein